MLALPRLHPSPRLRSSVRFQYLVRALSVSAVRLNALNLQDKYAQKLQRLADERGVSLEELKESAKKAYKPEVIPKPVLPASSSSESLSPASSSPGSSPQKPKILEKGGIRKDFSPVKPLLTFLNTEKIVQTPHTSQDLSALWNAYHASRSSGTGRGFLSASVPVETYERMLENAKKYAMFVLPLVRPWDGPGDDAAKGDKSGEAAKKDAYEFHLMQWTIYDSPPTPSASPIDDLFSTASETTSPTTTALPNPSISSILFTPLQEYKLRQTFATPQLIITHYTEFARSHGVVLLRGELTPRSNNSGDSISYALSQQDALTLAMGVQRFYLGGSGEEKHIAGSAQRGRLLQTFHEDPASFKWEELLEHADLTGY